MDKLVKLNSIVNPFNLSDPEIVKLSQEIDKVMVELQKEKLRMITVNQSNGEVTLSI